MYFATKTHHPLPWQTASIAKKTASINDGGESLFLGHSFTKKKREKERQAIHTIAQENKRCMKKRKEKKLSLSVLP